MTAVDPFEVEIPTVTIGSDGRFHIGCPYQCPANHSVVELILSLVAHTRLKQEPGA